MAERQSKPGNRAETEFQEPWPRSRANWPSHQGLAVDSGKLNGAEPKFREGSQNCSIQFQLQVVVPPGNVFHFANTVNRDDLAGGTTEGYWFPAKGSGQGRGSGIEPGIGAALNAVVIVLGLETNLFDVRNISL